METRRKFAVGTSLKRLEDARFLKGEAIFVTDIKLPNCLYCTFVRSIYSHAEIKRIDTERARAVPGVVEIYTSSDLDGLVGEVPCAVHLTGLRHVEHFPLARDEVNYFGEPIVAILTESASEGEDAAELVEIEYVALTPVIDPEEAVSSSASFVHEEIGTNIAYEFKRKYGETDEILATSPHVLRCRLYDQRVFAASIEPRASIASYDLASGELTLWSATQVPHILRTFVSRAIDQPENKLRVIAPDLGGAFGCKACVYAEEIVVPLLARLTRRPVRWVETRSESLVATTHGRDVILYAEVGADPSGKILAMKTKVIADLGAYLHLYTPQFAPSIATSIPSNYKIPAYSTELYCVYTNKMSTESYRGVVNAETCFFIERVMDLVASELGLEPAQVRLRNFVQPTDYPYVTVTGSSTDKSDHPLSLRAAMDNVKFGEFRDYQKKMREEKGRLFGIGLSSYWELGGVYPPDMTDSIGAEHGFFESATVRFLPTGVVNVVTGTSGHGQGHETTFRQMVSDLLQVPVEDIFIQHGDTSVISFGVGTFGSRSAAVGGGAISVACERVKQKARIIAASLLAVKPSEIDIQTGGFFALSDSSAKKSITWKDVAREAYLGTHLPPGIEPGLEGTCYFNPPKPTYASGTHIAIVEVDIESGNVKLKRYVAVNDFGKIINPMIVEGQLHGGIVQGLGQAMLEQVVFGKAGDQLSTSFLDYLIPTSSDALPKGFKDFEFSYYSTETKANPMGVKGMGECGAIAAPPAIVNAVEDALKGLNVQIFEMPLTPEKIWNLVKRE